MARLSPSSEDLLVVSSIQEEVIKYFKNTWSKKWFVHGSSFDGYEKIHNKKIFFENVKDVIDEELNKKYGLVKAAQMSISVDSIRRFILKSKSGFDDKVLEAFLILFNPTISLEDYKYKVLNDSKTDPVITKKKTVQYLKWVLPIVALVSVLLLFNYFKKSSEVPTNLMSLSIVPSVDFPKKVVVNCNLKGMKYRSGWVFIENLKLGITSDIDELTMLQYFPKNAKVKLVLDNVVVEEKQLIIPSDGWWGVINNTIPLSKESFINNGVMKVTNIPNDGKDYYYSFSNFKDFGIDGNLFTMEADIINNANVGGMWAYDVSVDILGTKGDITFNLLSPDATPYAILKVANTDFSELGNNTLILKNLGVLLEDWSKLKVTTHKNIIQIKLKDKVLVEDSYEGEIGNIVGLQFYVKGGGGLKNVQLYPYENPSKAIKL